MKTKHDATATLGWHIYRNSLFWCCFVVTMDLVSTRKLNQPAKVPRIKCLCHSLLELLALPSTIISWNLFSNQCWARFVGHSQTIQTHCFLIDQFKHTFWCLKEASQWVGSFEYPKHTFWLGNKKNMYNQNLLSDVMNSLEICGTIYGPLQTMFNLCLCVS